MRTVRTEDELAAAIKAGAPQIEGVGELAEAVQARRATKKRLRVGALLLAVGGLAAAPFTGGVSLFATGPSLATIIVVSVGAALLFAVMENYDEIHFEVGPHPVRLHFTEGSKRYESKEDRS